MRQERRHLCCKFPRDIQVAFDRNIQQAVRREEWPDYRKWLRFYLDFCSKYGQLDGVVRAKRHPYVPVVLWRSEVEAVLSHLEPPYRLVALLLYGCGLRLSECLELRVQCFNLDAMLLTVHDGQGRKTVPSRFRSGWRRKSGSR